MEVSGSRDCRKGNCCYRDPRDEVIRGRDYQDGYRRGGESRDRDHGDGEVSIHLARQMEMMLKGTISGKMALKGALSRQPVNGGGALEASCHPSERGFGLDLWHCSAGSLCLGSGTTWGRLVYV